MSTDDIDPSLRAAERPLDSLADGFSPTGDAHAQPKAGNMATPNRRKWRSTQEPVLTMTNTTPTHPVEPEPYPPGTDVPANPTQLPIEPEFGQALPPAEPEEPGVSKPSI
jgi:hypothetical protein